MLCMLLEYIFELCGWYSRLCCEHWFINKQTLAHKKPVWLEKTRLTSIEVQAVCNYDSYRYTCMLSLVHSNMNCSCTSKPVITTLCTSLAFTKWVKWIHSNEKSFLNSQWFLIVDCIINKELTFAQYPKQSQWFVFTGWSTDRGTDCWWVHIMCYSTFLIFSPWWFGVHSGVELFSCANNTAKVHQKGRGKDKKRGRPRPTLWIAHPIFFLYSFLPL